jgi:hypothetical protein
MIVCDGGLMADSFSAQDGGGLEDLLLPAGFLEKILEKAKCFTVKKGTSLPIALETRYICKYNV